MIIQLNKIDLKSSILAMSLLSAPAIGAEVLVDSEDARVQARISVSVSCEIDPITVDFGDLQNLTAADFKHYKTQYVSYECKNIPAGTKIRLRHGNGGYFTGTHIMSDRKTTIGGKDFNYHFGLKHSTNGANGSDNSFLYEWTAGTNTASQKFNQSIDFLLELTDIDNMNAAIAESGGSHTISLTLPFEIKVE